MTEWLLAAVAIALTAAVMVSSMLDRPGPGRGPSRDAGRAAGPAPTVPSPAGPAPTTAPPVGAGLAAWRAIGGTRVERTAAAPDRPAAAGFTGSGQADQGMTLAAVRHCAQGSRYAATVRLRASRPSTLVEVTLLELVGGRRFAADSVGAVLLDRSWLRVEVEHRAHRPGSALALEVVLPRGSPPTSVQVDDLRVTAGR